MITGMLSGTLLPIVAYALFILLQDTLVNTGVMPQEWGVSKSLERTIGILAICSNLLLIHYFNNNRSTNAMRGLIFPTIAFVVIWFIRYGRELAGFF